MNRMWLLFITLLPPLTGCENLQRSLVFSTGTTIGVEAAVSPSTDSPLQLLVGYKRAEILFAPVMEDGKTTGTYTIKKPPSVMAKLIGQVRLSGATGTGQQNGASTSIAQWFASGKAAEILARGGGVAALTDDPAIAREAIRAQVSADIREAEQRRDAAYRAMVDADSFNEMKREVLRRWNRLDPEEQFLQMSLIVQWVYHHSADPGSLVRYSPDALEQFLDRLQFNDRNRNIVAEIIQHLEELEEND